MIGELVAPSLDDRAEGLTRNYLGSDKEIIRRAYKFAERAHAHQKRESGEPYILHCLSAAQILADLGMDVETVVAALLHDTIEDTDVTYGQIEREFGPTVARLVDGVTKLRPMDDMEGISKEQIKAESLRKVVLAMMDDVRVALIKLADRMHNMSTLGHVSPQKRRRIAKETLEIFAPLANRLGIWKFKWELEDLCFRNLEPETYTRIEYCIEGARPAYEEWIRTVVEAVHYRLTEAGIEAYVSSPPKRVYSVYNDLLKHRLDCEHLCDTGWVLVIVDRECDCYSTLGILHSMCTPIPGTFEDFIATPKDNMYRSLHTSVIGPQGKTISAQIRTPEMHNTAELGIITHWLYNNNSPEDKTYDAKIAWLRQLMGWLREVTNGFDFVESMKSDFLGEKVHIFTPKGHIVDLPQGSTPIDFAYHIHTEVGNRCRGARVNGRQVGLDYRLQEGDKVEILTVQKGGPSHMWLDPQLRFTKTSRARNKIRQWLRRQDYNQNVEQGRDVLEREFKSLGVVNTIAYEEIAAQLDYTNVEDFLAAIGYGDISSHKITRATLEVMHDKERADLPAVRPSLDEEGGTYELHATGVGDWIITIADCCNPQPGDDVIGHIEDDYNVSVHRRDCLLILNMKEPEHLIEVEWVQGGVDTYPVDVRVEAYDRRGLVRDFSDAVSGEGVNMRTLHVEADRDTHIAVFRATLEVTDMNQLVNVLMQIRQIPNVIRANRQVTSLDTN